MALHRNSKSNDTPHRYISLMQPMFNSVSEVPSVTDRDMAQLAINEARLIDERSQEEDDNSNRDDESSSSLIIEQIRQEKNQ